MVLSLNRLFRAPWPRDVQPRQHFSLRARLVVHLQFAFNGDALIARHCSPGFVSATEALVCTFAAGDVAAVGVMASKQVGPFLDTRGHIGKRLQLACCDH